MLMQDVDITPRLGELCYVSAKRHLPPLGHILLPPSPTLRHSPCRLLSLCLFARTIHFPKMRGQLTEHVIFPRRRMTGCRSCGLAGLFQMLVTLSLPTTAVQRFEAAEKECRLV